MKKNVFFPHKLFLFSLAAVVISVAIAVSAFADSGHESEKHVSAPKGMSVTLKTQPAPGGVLVQLKTKKFRFAPTHMAPDHMKEVKHVQGEGHAHFYVNGTMNTLLVSQWTYIKLDPGSYTLKAGLNNNNHLAYVLNGKPVTDEEKVEVK